MKYINLFMTVLYIVSCIFVISYFNKCEKFYREFNETVEVLNSIMDRVYLDGGSYISGDTLFIMDNADTGWIFEDTSGTDKLGGQIIDTFPIYKGGKTKSAGIYVSDWDYTPYSEWNNFFAVVIGEWFDTDSYTYIDTVDGVLINFVDGKVEMKVKK